MLWVIVLVIESDLLEACFERFGSHCVRRRVSEDSCLIEHAICNTLSQLIEYDVEIERR